MKKHPGWTLLLLWACVSGWGRFTEAAGKPAKARQAWMAGYVKLEEAGKAEEKQDFSFALQLYREALEVFHEVRRRFPSWNPSLLSYRVSFCEERIRALDSRIGEQRDVMGRDELAAAVESQSRTVRELTEENRRLKARTASLSEALDRARREAARVVGTGTRIKELVAEKEEFQKQLAVKEDQIRRLDRELAKLKASVGSVEASRKLREELARAQARKAELREAFETYRKAYDNVKLRLRTASAAREKAEGLCLTLRERSEAQANQLRAAERSLADLRKKAQSLGEEKDEAVRKLAANTRAAEDREADRERLREEVRALQVFRDQAVAGARQNRDLLGRIERLTGQYNVAGRRVAELENQLDLANRAAATLEKQVAAAFAEARKAKETAAASIAEATRLEGLVRQGSGDLKQARELLEAEKRTAASLREEIARERLLGERLKAERDALAARRNEPVAEGEAGDLTRALQEQVAALKTVNVKQAGELEEYARQRRSSQARITRLEGELVRHREDAKTRAEELKAARAEWAQARENVRSLQVDLLAVAEVRRENKQLKKALTTAENVVREQARVLAAQQDKNEAVAKLGDMLKQRDKEQVRLRAELMVAREGEGEAKRNASLAEERLREQTLEVAELTGKVGDLEARVVALSEALQQEKRNTPRRQEREKELNQRLAEAEGVARALKTENARLEEFKQEQLALLRKQEKAISGLEETRNQLQAARVRDAEEIRRLGELVQSMAAKTEVVDGLASSLSDADTRMARLRAQLERARNERDLFSRQQRELASRLTAKDEEISRYRQLLARKQEDGDSRARGLLLDQIRQLSLRLEKETQRRQALERAVARSARTEEPVRTIPVKTERISAESERERRQREQRTLVRGYLRQGLAAEEEGNIEAATWNYRKVLANDKSNKMAAQRLGLLAVNNGDDEEAVRYLRHAFRLDPDDLDTLLPLGFCLARRGAADLAISMLSRAVALEPDNGAAQRCLGIAFSMLGWYEAAEKQFRRTYRIDKNDAENAFNLAVLLATREPTRMEEAKEWYTRARRLGTAKDPGLDRLFGMDE